MVELGPDGSFIHGGPINAEDKGGLFAGFYVLKEQRIGVMDFKVAVKWVAMPMRYIRPYTYRLRNSIIEAFGDLSYNKSELPIRVVRNRDVVELHFPQPVAILAANPELWLALAEVMEDVIKEDVKDAKADENAAK